MPAGNASLESSHSNSKVYHLLYPMEHERFQGPKMYRYIVHFGSSKSQQITQSKLQELTYAAKNSTDITTIRLAREWWMELPANEPALRGSEKDNFLHTTQLLPQ